MSMFLRVKSFGAVVVGCFSFIAPPVRASVLVSFLGLAGAIAGETAPSGIAQQLNWDLTYKNIFEDAKLSEHDSLTVAFGRGDAPNMPIFGEWQGKSVDGAIFIDSLTFWNFGYRHQTWMVKGPSGVTAYSYFEKGSSLEEKPMQDASFDLLIERLMTWQQSDPNSTLVSKYRKSGVMTGGYVGVVSLFKSGNSRQFLLTFEDLMAIDAEAGRMSGEPGAFSKLLAAAAASTTREELERRLNAGAVADRLFAAAQDPSAEVSVFDGLTSQEANQVGRDGRTLLMVAATNGNVPVLRKLIERGANTNVRARIHAGPYTALGMAARGGHGAAVEELLRHGAVVTEDKTAYRPYSEPLFEAAHAGHLDIVRLLIEHGADPEGLTQNEDTLLSYLFFGGHLPSGEMVEFVLKQGVSIDSPNRFGETALMRAVETADRGFDVRVVD